MEEVSTVATEITRDIVREGQHVRVVARYVDQEGWLLTIINDRCIMSTWHDFFASAEEALREGERAIDAEGIAAFAGSEGFEHLQDAGQSPRNN